MEEQKCSFNFIFFKAGFFSVPLVILDHTDLEFRVCLSLPPLNAGIHGRPPSGQRVFLTIGPSFQPQDRIFKQSQRISFPHDCSSVGSA